MRFLEASARARVCTRVSGRMKEQRDASHVHAEVLSSGHGIVCTPLVLDELVDGDAAEADAPVEEGMGEVDLEVCAGVEHAEVHVEALAVSGWNVAGRISTLRVTGEELCLGEAGQEAGEGHEDEDDELLLPLSLFNSSLVR